MEDWNLALDRIKNIRETDKNHQKSTIDWEEYFYDLIGVTRPVGRNPEKIELQFTKEQAPYIKTKPIHPSQKHYENEESLNVVIEVIPNFELESLILSFGERVKVSKPEWLKEKIQERLRKALL